MTDYQGGNGNGAAFYCAPDAILTQSSFYQLYSQQQLKDIAAPEVKAAIGTAYGSAEAAPIINYLKWILDLVVAIA
jgi:hypothetical protein